jgi:hypothetical protein
MKKGTSEEKIIYALRQVEGGKKATEVCREMGISDQRTDVLQLEEEVRGLGGE